MSDFDPNVMHVIWGLILCLWVGGLAMLTFLVGPVIFAISDSRAKAGAFLARILGIWKYFEYFFSIGLLLIGAWAMSAPERPDDPYDRHAPLAGATVMAILVVVNQIFVVGALLRSRETAGDLNRLPLTPDEQKARESFRVLHTFSIFFSVLTMAAGVFLIAWDAVRPFNRTSV